MATYLDNITLYDSLIQVKFAETAKEMRLLLEGSKDAQPQIDDINWWQQLVIGSNDTNQTEYIRLQLLTLLVDNARLNEVPLVNVFGLYQTLGDSTITASAWGLIGGNINDQADLIAKFNTYLPLSAGTTKPLTGALFFGSDGLGIDTINEGDTINIGASAGVIQFGIDADAKFGNITEGAWLASNIGVIKGGLGALDFASGSNGQAIVKSGSGYAFYTIPAIPDLSGYVKADGTVAMTADLLFAVNRGVDTTTSGTLRIGQDNANAVQIFPTLTVNTIAAGLWNGSVIGLAYGGTGANLAAPSYDGFFFFDATGTGGTVFGKVGSNLSWNGEFVDLSSTITGTIDWKGNVIPVNYGGTGLSSVGAEGSVLTVVSGVPAWAAFTALTNPMTTAGDIIYGGASGTPTRLAANATSTNKFLRTVSSGNPSWEILVAADIPNIAQSQVTGLTTALANKLGTGLTDGKMFVGNGANAAAQVSLSGDATMTNAGVLSIANSAVTFAKMQNITYRTLMGRWSAGDGPPQEIIIGTGLTLNSLGVLTSGGLTNPMTAVGDLIYGSTVGAPSSDPARLAIGTAGQVLTVSGGGLPIWATPTAGTGDVTGPSSATSTGIATYNGTTGKIIQSPSGATLSSTGDAILRSLQIAGTGGAGYLHLRAQASAITGLANYVSLNTNSAATGLQVTVGSAAFVSTLIFGATTAQTYTLPDATGTFTLLGNTSTGSGAVVLATSPTLTTPSIGAATGTSLTTTGALTSGVTSTTAGTLVLRNATNAFTQTIRGTGLAASIIYDLPITAPTAGQVLSSTAPSGGVATLSWSSAGSGTVTSVAALTLGTTGTDLSSTVATGTTTPVITLNVPDASATARGVITTGTQTIAGAKTFSGSTTFSISGTAITISGTGSKTAGAILFTGSAPRWIDFGATGAGAPVIGVGSRSDGTKLVLANTQGAALVDFAFGVTATALWSSVANNGTGFNFEWYGGATLAMSLRGDGQLTLTSAIIGAATQSVFNTVSTNVSAFGAATTLTIGATTGTATIRNATLNVSGDLKLPTVGTGLYVKEGTNATMGSATLVGGTVVVSTTKVTANSRIFLTNNVNGGTIGSLSVSARTAGTSFTISSTNVLDTSTISWIIIEPA